MLSALTLLYIIWGAKSRIAGRNGKKNFDCLPVSICEYLHYSIIKLLLIAKNHLQQIDLTYFEDYWIFMLIVERAPFFCFPAVVLPVSLAFQTSNTTKTRPRHSLGGAVAHHQPSPGRKDG